MSGHHIVPVKTYVLIFLALLFFTGLTAGVAFIDLGELNTVVALAIAVCKMLLVILFFMHVRYSSQLTRLVVSAAFLWLIILIGITSSDYVTRHWIPDPPSWGDAMPTYSVQQPTNAVAESPQAPGGVQP